MLIDRELTRSLIDSEPAGDKGSILLNLPDLPESGIGLLASGALGISLGLLVAVPTAGVGTLILATMGIGAGVAGVFGGGIVMFQELSGHTDDLRKTKQAIADAVAIGSGPLAALGGIWANGTHQPEKFSDAVAIGGVIQGVADLTTSLSVSPSLPSHATSAADILGFLGNLANAATLDFMGAAIFVQKSLEDASMDASQKSKKPSDKAPAEQEKPKPQALPPEKLPEQIQTTVAQISNTEKEMRERQEEQQRVLEKQRKEEAERLAEQARKVAEEAAERRKKEEAAKAAAAAAEEARRRHDDDVRRQQEDEARAAAARAEQDRQDAERAAESARRQRDAASQGRYGSGGTGGAATPPDLTFPGKG